VTESRSFGWWRVTDVVDEAIPKKSDVEVVVEGGALALNGPSGFLVRVPIATTFVRVDGPKKMVVITEVGRIWLDANGASRTDGLSEAMDAERANPTPGDGFLDPVVVVSYPGRTQADAAQIFAKHASELAASGYVPVSQSWAEGRPGIGRAFMMGRRRGPDQTKGLPHGHLRPTGVEGRRPGTGNAVPT
jgi:hypothetical protein